MVGQSFKSRVLRSVLMAVVLLGALPLTPAEAKDKASKPRIQVDDVPGNYIQLETLWVPVVNRAGNTGYMGLVVRLWPADDKRYEACIAAPKVGDSLMVDFNKSPLDPEVYNDTKKLVARMIAVIAAHQEDPKIFRKVEAIRDFVSPDEDSAMLTLTCR